MAWNLDDQEKDQPLPAAEATERPATIFDEPEAKPTPDLDRILRLEKKLNGALYLLRRAESARRNRRSGMFLLLCAGLAAVGYSYWPQLRDADWGAARDTATEAFEAYRDRALGTYVSGRFGDTELGRVLVGARAALDAAAQAGKTASAQAPAPAPVPASVTPAAPAKASATPTFPSPRSRHPAVP